MVVKSLYRESHETNRKQTFKSIKPHVSFQIEITFAFNVDLAVGIYFPLSLKRN